MDEFKPEDDLKPDPSDRRTGRSRQASDRNNEPQINFDDVDFDADERRPARGRNVREDEYDEADDDYADEDEQNERRPAKRKKALAGKPASRQYVMMAVGILVLLLLIFGIGSALKSPVTASNSEGSAEKSIDLSASNSAGQNASADQSSGEQTTPVAPAATDSRPSQDVSLPPIASSPTQGQTTAAPEGQQRVEVQGDLNSALSQQQGQLDNVVANSTLPTEPATVAPLRNGTAPRQTTAGNESQPRQPATTQGRQHAVIEAKPQSVAKAPATESKPAATQPKRTETPAARTPVSAPTAAAQPKATASAAAPSASASRATAGDVTALKS